MVVNWLLWVAYLLRFSNIYFLNESGLNCMIFGSFWQHVNCYCLGRRNGRSAIVLLGWGSDCGRDLEIHDDIHILQIFVMLSSVTILMLDSLASSSSLSHFYVGSMWDDSRLHAARSYTSPDSPFSLRSSFTRVRPPLLRSSSPSASLHCYTHRPLSYVCVCMYVYFPDLE